jgi:hypothetical protein
MWAQRWTFDTAWKYGQSKRPKMYPNTGFQRQLRQFEEELGDLNKDITKPFRDRRKDEVKSDEAV